MSNDVCWSIAIFSSREKLAVLQKTVESAINACGKEKAIIHVIINGNKPLAIDLAMHLGNSYSPRNIVVKIWHMLFEDKALAWNYYVYSLWEATQTAFFIDGYAWVNKKSLRLLADALKYFPAASGVPSIGRSAAKLKRKMLLKGGIHGNLFALSAETMQRINDAQFRLPEGIYRTDPTIGAVINFNFNPMKNNWNPYGVFVHPDATWDRDSGNRYSMKGLKAYVKRLFRQAQGDLENAAMKNHFEIERRPPGTLPKTISEHVQEWVKMHKKEANHLLLTNPLRYFAYIKIDKKIKFDALIDAEFIYSTKNEIA